MTTAIYIRTSTEEQNPELQLKDCESIAKEEYTLFQDKQSAWKDHIERQEFNLLKKQIKYHKIKHLIVWDLDRLYRHRKNLISFFKYCKVYKCKIHSFRQAWLEEINTMPEPWNEIVHDLMLQVMGWIAEEESIKKSERVKLAVTRKNNQTYSKYGNKWGRKQISTFKKKRILELRNKNEYSIRKISQEVGVSVGVVHKIVTNYNHEIRDYIKQKESVK